MRYQPHTADDVREMLGAIGVSDVDALFDQVPEPLRFDRRLELPAPLDEQRLTAHLGELAAANRLHEMRAAFLGAGAYEHFVPQVVDQLLMRGEFLTAYTPYQPELAQGTLKAIFEFQTSMSEIVGMDLANASMYDGAHATAEALLMGLRLRPKATRVLVSRAVHPEYRAVSRTYLEHVPGGCVEVPARDGVTDLDAIDGAMLDGAAMLLVQSPNFFGVVEDLEQVAAFCRDRKLLLGVSFTEPVAWGLLRPPGHFGADIVAGEGQSFGIAPGFGGPMVGVFACKQEFLRQTPGRLVSRTTDALGRESYVLTLATREQHIRRARATSNICTNQGLMALAATIYLSLLGRQGFAELAALNLARAEHAKALLTAIPGVSLRYPGPTFNEFVIALPRPASEVVAAAVARGIAPGVDLGRFDPAWSHDLLVAVTEVNDPTQIEALASCLRDVL